MASSKSHSSHHSHAGGSGSQTTTDHEQIRKWVEQRNGHPACVKGTGSHEDPGLLRVDFPGYSGEDSLQAMEWDEWFQKFDEAKLAFLYEEKTREGKPSRFSKLVARNPKG